LYGFGHEEWLFNYEWLISGQRYSFLQPIGKFFSIYSGETADFLLYTVSPSKMRYLVGIIHNATVLTEKEQKFAYQEIKRHDWLKSMRNDLRVVGADPKILDYSPQDALANIRFTPSNVEIFDPMPVASTDLGLEKRNRYQPYDWDGKLIFSSQAGGGKAESSIKRSEDDRRRSEQSATSYSPQHIMIQNALYDQLCEHLGKGKVDYEKNFVDLSFTLGTKQFFIEVKIENTAKRCIRTAIGQLLEYAHYPSSQKATRLIVVGDTPATNSDVQYCKFIRKRYGIPIDYWEFSWEYMEVVGLKNKI
jgi:hypothetical protein